MEGPAHIQGIKESLGANHKTYVQLVHTVCAQGGSSQEGGSLLLKK